MSVEEQASGKGPKMVAIINKDKTESIQIVNIKPFVIEDLSDLYNAIGIGQRKRHVKATEKNDRSSRGHTILVINYHRKNEDKSEIKGKLNIVDLAGSERVGRSDNDAAAKAQGIMINKSLSTLKKCIGQIAKK